MDRVTIYTNGLIDVDGRPSGYAVRQDSTGTTIYVRDGFSVPAIALPHTRYVLSTRQTPASGLPNRDEFAVDFLRALEAV